MELLLDGTRIESRDALYDLLQSGLRFPAGYGRNLDALHDRLGEITEDCVIGLVNAAALEEALGAYAEKLIRVLRRAEEENPHIRFYCGVCRPEEESCAAEFQLPGESSPELACDAECEK